MKKMHLFISDNNTGASLSPTPVLHNTVEKPNTMKKILLTRMTFILAFLVILFGATGAALGQTSVGPIFPGAGANVDGPGTESWINAGNILADDSDYATVFLPSYVSYFHVSEYLQGTGYGFEIPDGATIRGIEVKIMRQSSENNQNIWSVKDATLNLLKGGAIAGSDHADINTCWPGEMTEATYGSPTDLWGTVWSAGDINSSGFGVSFSVTSNSGGSRTAYVDYIEITVTYSPAGPDFTLNFGDLDFGYVYSGSTATAKTFELSGTELPELPGDITVTAPSADFQVSNDGTNWGSTTVIPYTFPTLNATTVYVRFTPQSSGLKSGNVTFTIDGRISPTAVSLTGTGVLPATHLAFVGFPGTGAVNLNFQPFTVEARGSDNTIDYLYMGDITLARVTGPGTITGTLTATAVDGVAAFSAVQADQAGDYTLSANSGALTQAISSNITIYASAAGDYFSAGSGTWGAGATWLYNNGSGWVTPASGPTSSNGKIIILNGHTVTVASSVTVDEVSVETGGRLTVNSGRTLTIADGPGTDLTVKGTVLNSGAIAMNGTAIFNGGSTYEHAQNGGTTIPAATWDAASTLLITGITNSTSVLGGLGQSFGNVTWNCPGQTVANSLPNSNFTYNGTLTIVSTGSASVQLIRSSFTGNVAHYVQTGGTAIVGTGSSTFTKRLNIAGNFSLSETGIFDISNGTGTSSQVDEIFIGGDFIMSGGTLRRTSTNSNGSTYSQINFAGNTIQHFAKSAGSISGRINFSVNPSGNGSVIDFGTSVLDGSSGTFALNSGGTLITANAGGITSAEAAGSVQITGTRTFSTGGNYIYNGVISQTTGTGLPSTVNSLEVNNTSGVWSNSYLTLTQNTTVTSEITVSSGILDLGAYTCDGSGTGVFTVKNGTTLLIEGSGNFPTNFSSVNLLPGSRVMYSYNGDQNIYATTYHNLYLAGSGTKTTDGVIVNGILFMGGTAAASAASPIVYGPSSALQYQGITAQTTGPEFPAMFSGSGGVIINNPNGVALNADKEITAELVIRELGVLDIGTYKLSAGTLNSSGLITINSTSLTQNGSFIPATITNSGTVVYNRQLTASNDLHFVSSPVNGNTSVNSDKITGVHSYNELGNTWPLIADLTAVESGKGYNLDLNNTSDGKISFSGTLVSSDINIPVTSPYRYNSFVNGTETEEQFALREFVQSGDGSHSGAITRDLLNYYGGGGWNLLGNPYTSAIKVSKFIDANYNVDPLQNQFDPNYVAVYLYNAGTYQYIGIPTGWPFGNELTGVEHIQAGQGFFVLAMNDNSTFVFKRDMQEHSTGTSMLKSAKAEDRWPGLQLKVKYGEKESLTTVVFTEEMTAGLDPGYDVGQFSSGADVEVYTSLVMDNGINFARQALPIANCDKNIIPVGVDSKKGGEITFSADIEPLANNKFWLEDRSIGTFTNLNSNTYTASIPAGTYGTGRFFIIASANTPTGVQRTVSEETGTRIWISNGEVIIKGEVSDRARCTVYDVHGQKIVETNLIDGELNTVSLPKGSNGVLIVRVVDGVKVTTKKVALL
jgi:hypothetical protein